jgi:hypothetical protein
VKKKKKGKREKGKKGKKMAQPSAPLVGLWWLDLLTTTDSKGFVRDKALLTLQRDGSLSSNTARQFSFPNLESANSVFETVIIGAQSGTWKALQDNKVQLDFYYFLYAPLVIARDQKDRKDQKDLKEAKKSKNSKRKTKRKQYRAFFPCHWVAHITFVARLENNKRLFGTVQSTHFYPLDLFQDKPDKPDKPALPPFPSVPHWLGTPITWTFRGAKVAEFNPGT